MSSISTNLAFMIKTAADQFTDAKLEDARFVKDDMTDQQQNSDNIIDSFDVLDMSNLLNQASFNEASEAFKAFKLPAFYQCLNCSHINI